MLQLQTFGTLDLRTSTGTPVGILLAQPRSMALLIYLLLARPRGFQRRDLLCALFWPDADAEHARGALSQALTRIRRSAGTEVIELRGKSELRIVPGAVQCDVLGFENAITSAQQARALELYAGPFLSGFHASHMPGFERWAEAERDRLRSLASGAARALAGRHIAEQRLPDAEQAAARALALTPESEAVAQELVCALAAAGDRAGALSLYDSWVSTLAHDLELEPSDELQAIARDLRVAGTPAAETSEPGAALHVEPLPTTSSPPAGSLMPPAVPNDEWEPRWWKRRRVVVGVAVAFVLVLGGWGLVQAGLLPSGVPVEATGRAGRVLTKNDWLIVADFQSPSTDPALALAFQTLLIRDLEAAGYASVVGGLGALSRRALDDVLARMRLPPGTPITAELACEIAEREGAAGVLAGRMLPLGKDYVLAASILSTATCDELIRASTVASFDELAAAVAAVSRELRSRMGESRSSIRRSPALPPMTAGYIDALRAASHYINTPELWDDALHGAVPLHEAIRVDPDFAFAHFLLALHYQRLGRFDQAMPHVLRAYELREQLPRPGRLGMEAIYQRYIASDPRAAMATVETIIADFPAVADATMPFLADAALWVGDFPRALQVSLEYLQAGPSGLGAHLAFATASSAAWALGRVELADSLYRAGLMLQRGAHPSRDGTLVLLHSLRHGDWAGAEAYCTNQPLWDRCGYVFLARGRLSAAARVFAAVAAGDTAKSGTFTRATRQAALVQIEILSGRSESAWSTLQQSDRSMPMSGLSRAGTHLKRFVICATAASLHRSSELPECGIERENPADWDADPTFAVLLRSGAWSRRLLAVRSLERGDATSALEQARAAVRSNFGNAGMIDHLILATAFDALSQRDSALARYVAATRVERDCCFPTLAAVAFPLAHVYRRIGELAEQAGDLPTALAYYGAFVDLWEKADPELRPQVRAVRAHMSGLQERR